MLFRSTLPIALGAGTGAESRRPLGITVVGGLAFSQFITLYVTPVIYTYFDQWSRRVRRKSTEPTMVGTGSPVPAGATFNVRSPD